LTEENTTRGDYFSIRNSPLVVIFFSFEKNTINVNIFF